MKKMFLLFITAHMLMGFNKQSEELKTCSKTITYTSRYSLKKIRRVGQN